MSMQILEQVNQELYRLAVAGSGLAQGDYRLRRHIESLMASSQTAPIFGRVAALLETCLESGAPDALLEAAALTQAILATRVAPSAADGPLTALPCDRLPLPDKPLNYRRLEEVRQALRQGGTGRMELLTQFVEEDGTGDFRLLPDFLAALDDSYFEIPPLCIRWLKRFGHAVLPLAERDFDLDRAGRGDVHRLQLMSELLLGEGLVLYRRCVAEGGRAIRAAAVETLSRHAQAEDIPLLESCLKDRAKEVREAAIRALGQRCDERSVELLASLAEGKEYQAAIKALGDNGSPQAESLLLSLAETLAVGGEEAAAKLAHVTEALGNHKTQAVYDYLCRMLDRVTSKTMPSVRALGMEVIVTQALCSFNTANALDVMEKRLEKLQKPGIVAALALTHRTPREFYKIYGAGLKRKEQANEIRQFLRNLLTGDMPPVLYEDWNDYYIKQDDGMMVALTAQPGMKHAIRYMRRFAFCKTAKTAENFYLVMCTYPRTLLRLGVDDFWDDLMDAFERIVNRREKNSAVDLWRLREDSVAHTLALGGPEVLARIRALSEHDRYIQALADRISVIMADTSQ